MSPLQDESPHTNYQSFGPKEPSWCTSVIQSLFFCCFPKIPDRNYSLSSRGSSVSSKRSIFANFSSRGRTSSIDTIPYMLFENLVELPELSQKTKDLLIRLGLDPSSPEALTTTMQYFLKSNQHMLRQEQHYCFIPIVDDDVTLILLLPNKELKTHAQVVEIATDETEFYHDKLHLAIDRAIELGDNLTMMASQSINEDDVAYAQS